LSQSTRVTDGHTDRILIARPRLHSMQRGKNVKHTNTQDYIDQSSTLPSTCTC